MNLTKKTSIIIAVVMLVSLVATIFTVQDATKKSFLEQAKVDNMKLVKAYSHQVDITDTQKLVDQIDSENELAYALFISTDLKAISHSNPERIGITLDDEGSINAAQKGEEFVGYFHYSKTDSEVLDVLMPIKINGKLQGALNIGIPVDEKALNKAVGGTVMKLSIVFSIVSLLSILILVILSRKFIISPIKELTNILEKHAELDFVYDQNCSTFKHSDRKDEIGIMIRALHTMEQSIRDFVYKTSDTVEQISASSQEFLATTEQTSNSANEVSIAINDIAKGVSQQAEDTETVAVNIGDMGKLIEQDAMVLKELNKVAEYISLIKNETINILKSLVDKTNQSGESAKSINDVINENKISAEKIEASSDMIKDISRQTNLLALNASIEAARAGEHGKGFAVVADEIRKLATQSNQFADDITVIIKELKTKSINAVDMMGEVKSIVGSQTESVMDTERKVSDIAIAIESIEKVILKLNESSERMDKTRCRIIDLTHNLSAVSEENAAGAEQASASIEAQTVGIDEIAKASEGLAKIAEELLRVVKKFKV